MAIVETLAFAVVTETDPNVKAVLKQLSSEFSDFATQAADRIINASAFHDANTTVERALAEIFQASDAYVQDLLAPTPGADWSVEEITGAVKDALAAGNSASSLIKALQQTGVDAASQSMTTLSLNLEAYVKQTGSDGWGAIAAKAGGAALLLDALFNSGYAPALQVNEAQPFYLDAGLADRVQALLSSSTADFDAAAEYLPDSQALAWLVNSIDAGFSTDDLNHLIAAASASGDQAGVQHLVEALAHIVSGPGNQHRHRHSSRLLPFCLCHDRRGAIRLSFWARTAEPGQHRRRIHRRQRRPNRRVRDRVPLRAERAQCLRAGRGKLQQLQHPRRA